MGSTGNQRRYDVDWLRIFATYLLLLFHTAMVFNPAPFYHIRNADVSFLFLILCGFISLWHMPLFFLLAGWSASSSLSIRGRRGFLTERVFRLLVPLVAGCILLMPPIKFLELSNGLDANYTGLYVAPELQESFHQVIPTGLPSAPPFNESFLEFLPTFYTDLARFTWAHLWFVAYLLTFTILYLPLFEWIRTARGGFARKRSTLWIYAPIVPLAVVQVSLRPYWPGLQNLIDDWANFAYYSIYLLCGFMLARFPELEAAAHRERKRALGIALAATAVLLLGVLGVFDSARVILAHTAIAGWCFVLALLGWARTKLSFSTPALGPLAESALPVYLLHQSAIVIPGYALIQLPLDLWTKFFALLLLATVVTLSVYVFLVRPFTMMRFLFGMKADAGPLRHRLATGATATAIGLFTATVFASSSPTSAVEQHRGDPIGVWYAEGGAARVEIQACGAQLCGKIIWLRSPFDENGCELTDRYNSDQSLRHRPVLGLEILRGLAPDSRSVATWRGGTIYDPGSGSEYRAVMTMIDENRLELRGYIGIPIIGRTTSWFRVGAEREVCRAGG